LKKVNVPIKMLPLLSYERDVELNQRLFNYFKHEIKKAAVTTDKFNVVISVGKEMRRTATYRLERKASVRLRKAMFDILELDKVLKNRFKTREDEYVTIVPEVYLMENIKGETVEKRINVKLKKKFISYLWYLNPVKRHIVYKWKQHIYNYTLTYSNPIPMQIYYRAYISLKSRSKLITETEVKDGWGVYIWKLIRNGKARM